MKYARDAFEKTLLTVMPRRIYRANAGGHMH